MKTAVRQITAERGGLDPRDQADLAASVELAICDALIDRTGERDQPGSAANTRREDALVAAGGVASNKRLRQRLTGLAESAGLRFVAPPPALCTDNGAMIAWAGIERLRLGLVDGLDAPLRPRWPLDAARAAAAGSGRQGVSGRRA